MAWLAKILKVKALIVGASSLNIVEFGQNFNDRFNVDVDVVDDGVTVE